MSSIYEENWAWVDQRLEEMYHGYGVTADNYDDYIDAGLLVDAASWTNDNLQTHFDSEFEDRLLCPAPMRWVLYKNYESQYCLEEESMSPRSRAESDISDHSAEVDSALKRLEMQSPLPQGMYPIDYSHLYAVADEVASVEETFGNCSPISDCSEKSRMTNFEKIDSIYDFGYDSF